MLMHRFLMSSQSGGNGVISYVGGQAGGRVGATTSTVVNFSFTGGSDSTPQPGDLVVVAITVGVVDSNPTQAPITEDYTSLTQLNNVSGAYDIVLHVAYKRMGAVPDTSVTLRSTGSALNAQHWTIQCFRDVSSASPMDVTPVSATGTGTARADPPSITPITDGAWVVICGGGAAPGGRLANYVAPTNFSTNFLTGFATDSYCAISGSGYWDGWTSGAVNPDQYTGGSNVSDESWAAYTIALRPS